MMDDLTTMRGSEPRTPEEWLTFLRTAREHTLHLDEVFRRDFGGAVCHPIVSMPAGALDPLIEQLELAHERLTTNDRLCEQLRSADRQLQRAKAIAVIAIVLGILCAAAAWMVVAFS